MKKDFSQLGIIPSAALGMLGYSSGIGILRWLSALFDIPLQTSSVAAIDDYRLIVACLFALVPWVVLLIGLQKYGTEKPQPLLGYVLGAGLMLFAIVGGLGIELLAMSTFKKNVEDLVSGEQWLFSLEELHPLRAGLGGLLLAAAILFLTSIWSKK